MNDIPESAAATPLTEPICEGPGTARTIYGLWLVGGPGDDGYQAYAELRVTHDVGRGYSAQLGVRSARTEDYGTSFRLQIHLRPERIAVDGPKRFNRAKLSEIFEDAVTELRRRFEAGDEAVTVYFDRSSEVFARV